MKDPAEPTSGAKLRRVLGLRDLVLLNIAAIVGLRWLSTAAQLGPASLALWLLGVLLFFIPLGMAVLELSSRIPGEGGLYLWAKAAFGDAHGFIAGWTYWISNLVFFPSMLLFGAGVSIYVGGDDWLPLRGNAGFNAVYCLVALWGATLLNILGLERAKWLQNIGAVATWTVTTLVMIAGALAWRHFGPATSLAPTDLMPDFGSFSTFTALAIVALAYSGLELGPIMGGEIREPRKVLPRAILISAVCITIIYMAGTASLLIALPKEQIDIIGGIPQALAAVGERLGIPAFGPVTAALLALANLGGLGAFLSGTTRLPFVVGVDRYLPASLASLHPRFGTPWVALLVQSTITSGILLVALSGATIREAFVLLLDMTAILSLLPLLYIFAALPVLRMRVAGRDDGITLVPGGTVACWIAAGIGFATTTFAIVTSALPPDDGTDKLLFLTKVVGGSLFLIGVGLIAFLRGSQRAMRPAIADTDS
jgi:glutamate:GABA antiporter